LKARKDDLSHLEERISSGTSEGLKLLVSVPGQSRVALVFTFVE